MTYNEAKKEAQYRYTGSIYINNINNLIIDMLKNGIKPVKMMCNMQSAISFGGLHGGFINGNIINIINALGTLSHDITKEEIIECIFKINGGGFDTINMKYHTPILSLDIEIDNSLESPLDGTLYIIDDVGSVIGIIDGVN